MNEKKQQAEILKIEEKRRELYHKEMMKKDRESRNQVKVAPSDDVIIFKDINKIYGNHIQAVFNFDLSIKENEFIVLVGPSGCGKSTTLKMIAGIEDITSGDLFLNGKYSNAISSQKRNLAMVFQSYALYPNMTVYKNIAFPLMVRHESRGVIDTKVREVAKILELDDDMLKRRPAALSGGQRQRVALARAMVKGSKILLMDEPLSNLDAKLRVAVRSEIVSLHKRLNATTIYVTHDQTEAMTMADRIVVMDRGYIQQIGEPQEIYDNPANLFVATFIGAPSMNICKAKLDGSKLVLENNIELKISNANVKAVEKYYEAILEEINQDIKNKEAEKAKRIHDISLVGYLKEIDKFDKECNKRFLEIKSLNMRLDTLNESDDKFAYVTEQIKEKEASLKEFMTKGKENIENKEYKTLEGAQLEDVIAKDDVVKICNLDLERMADRLNEYKKIIENNEKEMFFGVRPEDILLSSESKDRKNLSKEEEVYVGLVELLGHEYYLSFKVNDRIFNIKASAANEILPEMNQKIKIDMDKIHIFDPITKRRIF